MRHFVCGVLLRPNPFGDVERTHSGREYELMEIGGLATSLWQAIAGRVIAGLGGAGMIALIPVIITGMPTNT